MGSFSIWHWLVVLVIVLLVFGTKKLRNVGSDLGGAVKGFKQGMKETETSADDNNTNRIADSDTLDAEVKEKSDKVNS
tara:strand:- start:457 stop:690 length:234 start_codon:yes stop_codon:yes gene_type:complete